MTRLPDDAFVAMDPAVEILDVEVDECSLLCHTGLETGMVVPPGDGLLDFVQSLMGEPVRVGALREEYDDDDLIDAMLSSLVGRGFARATPQRARITPSLRRGIVIDLDDDVSVDAIDARWNAGETAPEVLLRCARLSDHRKTFAALTRRRAAGALLAHHVVVRAQDVRCDARLRQSLLRLGAAVEIDGIAWPAPDGAVSGLAELARDRISTHVIMTPDASLLDERVRERCIAWITAEFISGLCLRLVPFVPEQDFASIFDAVRTLEHALGDVFVTNMPSDEMLLGNTDRGWLAGEKSAKALRRAYVRWRIPILKAAEGENAWSQVPESEDRWIRVADDLLPNHPELLQLRPGSAIVDLCGGFGRVARRLAPAVGRHGVMISVEMRRFVTERARRYAYEAKRTNLQFRVGLAERLPLPDAVMDAAVNEWTGAIWELGLGSTMIAEMARVVRPGGRVAVTHRLVQLGLEALDDPWVQYADIYKWVREAFAHPQLTIVTERVWGQVVPSKAGDHASLWYEQFLPRLVDPNDWVLEAEEGAPLADVYLTVIAERRA